jgi:hypothetical protein
MIEFKVVEFDSFKSSFLNINTFEIQVGIKKWLNRTILTFHFNISYGAFFTPYDIMVCNSNVDWNVS